MPPKPQEIHHDIAHVTHGSDFQFLEVELDPGERVIAEKGAMLYIDDGVDFRAKLGDGTDPPPVNWLRRLFRYTFGAFARAMKRAIVRESIFLVHFHNPTRKKLKVGLTASTPGQVICLELDKLGGEVIAEKHAFLCAAAGTRVGISLRRKLSTSLFGGEGLLMQRITGQGKAFLHAYGTVLERHLKGETILVDTGCLVAYQPPNIDFTITPAGGMRTMAFAGEGIFVARLSGHGKVWLQSLPRPRKKTKQQPSGSKNRQSSRRKR